VKPADISGIKRRNISNTKLMNGKNKNISDVYRGINEFKRVYQPRSNLPKDKNGDLLADSQNILKRWRNYFSQLLNVHNLSDVRQIKVHTAEPLVPGPSRLEVEITIANYQVVIKFQRN
jgi:hypothetical protein